MAQAPRNLSDIHLEDYTDAYTGRDVGAEMLFFTEGRTKESLNGLWHYAIDQYDTCLRQRWFEERYTDNAGRTLPVDFSFDEWPEIMLPCSWNLQDEKLYLYESAMVFTRTFPFSAKPGERVFLRFGAANYTLRVFLNRVFIGAHRGGSTPAVFEITDTVKDRNRILVVVDAARRPEQVPTENTDWFNYGGIFRDIDLYRLPETFIRDFRIHLVPDGKLDRISAKVLLSAPVDTQALLIVPELGVRRKIPIRNGQGSVSFRAKPELWSPNSPRLYAVSLETDTDRVRDEVGFREIRTEGREILLNGKPLFLRGVSCHEDSLSLGKAFTQAECEKILSDARELGCNFMRLAHYPHTEWMSRLADRAGMLLWEEIPVYWAIRFRNRSTYADAENQLLELIRRDVNRASVIIWSVGNENADSDERYRFMKKLALRARKEDGTRPVSAACLVSADTNTIEDRLADVLDIIGINEYYGWYSPDFDRLPELFANSDPDKPVIITEFGADAMYGHRGSAAEKGTEDCQAEVYRRQVAEIQKIPYIKGMTPWILYDFRCPRRTSVLQQYWNRKGLLTPDRKHKKLAWSVLHDFYLSLEQDEKTSSRQGAFPRSDTYI